jgi:hypothetical protein
MPRRPGETTLSTHLDPDLAKRFQAFARLTDGGVAAALRRLVAMAVSNEPPPPLTGVGQGGEVKVRFRAIERAAVTEAANARQTSPANWLRSLALVHLTKRPQWNDAEMDALRGIAAELRRIGGNINQIARAINNAQLTGQYPQHQGIEVKEAAEILRYETRRLAAVMTGNFDYWGLPNADRPSPSAGANERRDAEAKQAEAQRKRLPKRRRYQFDD